MKASSSEPWITKGCEPSTKQNNSWINTFLWVLSGFVFLLCWRWKYTHACNLGQGYLVWRLKESDGWGLVFAYEIWLESRLAVELRIMAEQQQSRALVSSALILPRPASRSATISSIPQRGPVWQGVVVVGGGGGVIEDAPVKAAHISQPHTLPTIQACGAGRASKTSVCSTTIFPQQRRSRGAQTAKGCWGGPLSLHT